MYKSYIHIINLYEKKTIKQVNTKKIHILQKYTIKINFLKLSLNKKKSSFAYSKCGILTKI
jgi:hypothetical protein